MSVRRLKRALGPRTSVEVSEHRGVRTLHLGGEAIQSAMRLSAPDQLELAYTRAMMAALLFLPEPRDVLMIGLGGGSIARFVHTHMPDTRVTAVEINEQVVAAARSFFGLPYDDERLKVHIGDGGEYVPAHRNACDILMLDAFEDGCSVPELATLAYYKACRACLRAGGVLAVNFIRDEPRFETYLERIERAFDDKVLLLPCEGGVNNIVFAFKDGPVRLGIDTLKRRARALKRRYRLPFDAFLSDLLYYNGTTANYLRIGLER
ncbi:MAG: methyltransferase domain-containing protein [Pseudomonadota bacterium]|nr:MAG: spermidine synthase [Pseudomonadota bacterium]